MERPKVARPGRFFSPRGMASFGESCRRFQSRGPAGHVPLRSLAIHAQRRARKEVH